MKKVNKGESRKEYKRSYLGKGLRGKYFKEYQKGSNLALISPDVAAAFPDDSSVNKALRMLLEMSDQALRLTKNSSRRIPARS